MKTRLPALNAIHVFDTAARHQSFVKAAQELNVTHGAVSRQIRLLEESLGVALFERRNRAVFLTPAGISLSATSSGVFEQLRSAIELLRAPARNAPLVVSCEPTIAMKWLIPRLGDFYRRHPEIQLHIFAAGGPVELARDRVDVALRRNDFFWDRNLHAEVVCDEWVAPVCVPALKKRGKLDLGKQRLLHTATRKNAWASWMKTAEHSVSGSEAASYEHFYLSLQAACAGLGVAIGSIFMVQEELDGGRLLAPFGFARDGSAYCLLSSAPFEADPRKSAFLKWLRSEMKKSVRRLNAG